MTKRVQPLYTISNLYNQARLIRGINIDYPMIEKFLKTTGFSSEKDFAENLEFNVPDNFNFAYDVMDEWARIEPDKRALLWVDDQGREKSYTFGELKELTDRTAAYFISLGIGHGDMVMLILKRRVEFWFSMLALHKIGAVAIPATHMLTAKDIVYRNNRAEVKAIVCVGEEYVMKQVHDSLAMSPSLKTLMRWSAAPPRFPRLAPRMDVSSRLPTPGEEE